MSEFDTDNKLYNLQYLIFTAISCLDSIWCFGILFVVYF